MTRARQLANCIAGVTVRDLARAENNFEAIKSYWRDPAPWDAETARNRAIANAAIDAAVRKNHPHITQKDQGV